MPSLRDRIAHTLVSRGLVTAEALDAALAQQRAAGGNLQRILVEQGTVGEGDLLAALSEGLGIPLCSLSRMKIDPALKALIPRDVAVQYQLVPVACLGQTLTVAMAEPLNVIAVDTLTTLTGLTITPLLASPRELRETIDQYYGTGMEETVQEFTRRRATLSQIEIVEQAPDGRSNPDQLLTQSQEAPVVKYTDALLAKAVRMKASDLFIEPRETTVRVRFRLDGLLQEIDAPPRQLHAAIVSRIKVMSELNIAETRLPQDGHFSRRIDERQIDFRVSVLPSSYGGNVCIRVLDKGAVELTLELLGFSPRDLECLRQCAAAPHGMLLTTGPTGSGKTTTLYALLKLVNAPGRNLVTVEDPVEYELEGINQVNVKAAIGLTFARALRAMLRQDPDVIMVGEIRDQETADMAIKAALTGHLVLSTLHTNSAAGSVVRLTNMGVEPFLLTSCLRAVIGQRLVRKVCPRCAQPYHPAPGVAQRLGLLDAQGVPLELVRGAGCRMCRKTGYAGREVIAEVLVMTPEIRRLLAAHAPEQEVERAAVQQGMQTLRQVGLAKAAARITTLEEVFRTTVGEVVDG